ncbi:MAG: sulfotransferase [Acidobacteria bacterium]|nr:sulfotransferase [Acidobacteriota bacterium]
MAVCILGSSRSGTSLVTRALNVCGLNLGPAEDLAGAHEHSNPAGYWENLPIQRFNEELLQHLGGSWCVVPDMAPGWASRPDLEPYRNRARRLVAKLAEREPWGWKDPRNSLTLPLWQELIPELRVVVCVRNPLEAASSIQKAVVRSGVDAPVVRLAYGLELWGSYQGQIRRHLKPGRYIVTHYESWFSNPHAELIRVASWVGLSPGPAELERAVAGIDPDLRRNIAGKGQSISDLPPSICTLYEAMCAEAGEVFRATQASP